MNSTSKLNNSLTISYLELRTTIGVIAMMLPFVLVIGKDLIEGWWILNSVSDYYYSVMGNVFVGAICAIAVFLGSYRGYERKDAVAGNLACVFGIGTALFPTSPETFATANQTIIGYVHLFFAGCFFLTLAYFALVLFRKTFPNGEPTRMKLLRNKVYAMLVI